MAADADKVHQQLRETAASLSCSQSTTNVMYCKNSKNKCAPNGGPKSYKQKNLCSNDDIKNKCKPVGGPSFRPKCTQHMIKQYAFIMTHRGKKLTLCSFFGLLHKCIVRKQTIRGSALVFFPVTYYFAGHLLKIFLQTKITLYLQQVASGFV